MNLRRLAQTTELAVLVLAVAVHVVLFLTLSLSSVQPFGRLTAALASGSSITVFLADALIVLQPSLLVLLLVCGPGRWFVRWPLMLPITLLAMFVVADSPIPTGLLFPTMIGTLVLSIAVRTFGWRLSTEEPAARPLRFSLAWILTVTAGISVAVGGIQAIRNGYLDWEVMPETPGFASVGLLFVVALGLGIWSLLMGRVQWARIFVFAVVTPALGLAAPYMWQAEPSDYWEFGLWFVCYGAWLAATCILIRCSGYRLIRRPRPTAGAAPALSRSTRTPKTIETAIDTVRGADTPLADNSFADNAAADNAADTIAVAEN